MRFSLRTFLVLVTAACLSLGWYASQAVRQRDAVQAIQRLGGYCHYDDERLYMPRHKVNGAGQLSLVHPPAKNWLRLRLGDDWFATVNCVTMTGRGITDASLAEATPHLDSLWQLSRLGLKPLERLQSLSYLQLFETRIRIDDPDLIDLRQSLPALRVGY